jgi:mannose-6-phosphate isomerase-like protein (cupin superfamily)
VAIWRRDTSGQVELHKTQTDVIVVQSGQATLTSGGTIMQARITTADEVRGVAIQGGKSQPLMPGAIVHIPPGTPHQFILEKGKSITYLALKIRSR